MGKMKDEVRNAMCNPECIGTKVDRGGEREYN